MPNTKRRFADDDASDDDEVSSDEEEANYGFRGGGKGLRVMGGKALRPTYQEDENDDDDDDSDDSDDSDESEDDEEPASHPAPAPSGFRGGGGKQLRPSGGKQLRPAAGESESESESESEDDDDDDDEDESAKEPEPVRVIHRGGGKALMRMKDSEDEEDDSSDDDESDEPQPQSQPTRAVNRGGGKALRMRPPSDEDDEEDSEDSDDEEAETNQPSQPVRVPPRGGGKMLRPAPDDEEDSEDDDDDDEEESEEEEPNRPYVMGGGKMLRRPVDDDDDDDVPKTGIRAPETNKQLPKSSKPPNADKFSAGTTRPHEGDGKEMKVTTTGPSAGGERTSHPDDHSSSSSGDEAEMEIDEDIPAKGAKRPQDASKASAAEKPEPMEESEDDDDDDDDDDDEESSDEEMELDIGQFDTQKLVKDEEDQKYLDSLTEVKREEILAERFEKLKAERDMKIALRESKRKKREEKAAKGTKVKKGAEPKDKTKTKDTVKKAERSKGTGASTDAAAAAATTATAAAKVPEAEQQVDTSKEPESKKQDGSDESGLDFGADDSEDSDDDYEEDGAPVVKPWQEKEKKPQASSSKVSEPDAEDSDVEMEDVGEGARTADDKGSSEHGHIDADLEDFKKVTIPRRRLQRWCNEPFFEKAVLDFFVRLFIGENDGQKCYRLCEVVGVNSGKVTYKFPPSKHQRPVSTNKVLRLRFGDHEREFPMYLISDAAPTDEDVSKYISVLKAGRSKVLSKKKSSKLRRKQDELVNNYTYTTDDIEKNIKERKKRGTALKNLGLEQTKISIAVQAARDAVEEAKRRLDEAGAEYLKQTDVPHGAGANNSAVEDAEKQLKAAEDHLKEKQAEEESIKQAVETRKRKLTQRSTDKNWAKVNKRAARANQRADLEALKLQKEKAASQTTADGVPKFNPYARRKVKPKILWEVGQQDEQKDESKESMEGKKRPEGAADKHKEPEGNEDSSTPSLVQEQHEKAVALSQSHQFAINEEVLASTSSKSSKRRVNGKRVRRGLSLDDYLKRKSEGAL